VRIIFILTTSFMHNFLCKQCVHITYERRKKLLNEEKKKKKKHVGSVHMGSAGPRSRSDAAPVAPGDRLLDWFFANATPRCGSPQPVAAKSHATQICSTKWRVAMAKCDGNQTSPISLYMPVLAYIILKNIYIVWICYNRW
jgi:hypothetical protein